MRHVLITELPNGKELKPVTRMTEKGASDYANRMFNKYGEEVRVHETIMDKSFNIVVRNTWQA